MQRLDRCGTVKLRLALPLAVFVGDLFVARIKARNVAIDEAPRVAAPERAIFLCGIEVPDAQQRSLARQFAVLAGVFGLRGEGQAIAKVVEAKHRQGFGLPGDEQSRTLGQRFANADLVVGQP